MSTLIRHPVCLNELSRFRELETPPPPCGRRLQANRSTPTITQPYSGQPAGRFLAAAIGFLFLAGTAATLQAQVAPSPPNTLPAPRVDEAPAPETPGDEAGKSTDRQQYVVTITNVSSASFAYRLRHFTGRPWSQKYTIAPDKTHRITVYGCSPAEAGRPNVYNDPGNLVIRHPMTGGVATCILVAGKKYGYVVNSNGFGELVEARDVAPPQPQFVPITEPGEEQERLITLQANHSFDHVPFGNGP